MSRQTRFKHYDLGGVQVDAVTIPQAVDYVLELTADHSRPAGYVVKPYVEFMDKAAGDADFRRLLNQAEICLPDGIALNWAAYYLYGGRRSFWRWLASIVQILAAPQRMFQLLPDRISGINFTWPLLQQAAAQHLKVFLVGTPKSQTIGQTATVISQAIPGLQVVGTYGGFFPPGDETELLQLLRQTQPDVILVGTGLAKQEQLMARLSDQLDHGIFIGEGGSFDYQQFGGRLPKAPGWTQRLNLEWAWRLLRQPWRLRRQLAIPRYLWRVYRQGNHRL